MRIVPFALALLVLTTVAVAASPVALAKPDLPPIDGCGFWHVHDTDVGPVAVPTYHYHYCI